MFRAERRTVVAVTPPGDDVQRRFVGLLATNAYRVSVLDIPGVGAAVADALDLDDTRMHSHTGRAMRTVLENLPRELLLELDPTAAARLVAAVVGLQERQVVRVFEVPEPVGPWITVLVYLPRNRFTAELPERIADIVAQAYGADRRTFEPHLGSSSLARITVSVRCPDRPTSVDLDALEHTIDEQSTSWAERLRSVLVADVGEIEARRLFDRVGSHAPVAYRAAVPPERAEHDVRRIAELLAGDDEMIDVARPVASTPRRGSGASGSTGGRRRLPLSELLPLLDHLGLQALDEQPYTFHVGGERVFVYDIGVRVPAGVELDDVRRRAVQDAFAALVAGTVESDGFNRLVLLAGLERARGRRSCAPTPSTCARSGSPSARRTSRPRWPVTPASSPTSSRCSTPASTRPGRRPGERRIASAAQAEVRERIGRARSMPSPASTTTASAGRSSR